MFALQRELGFGVVERAARHLHTLPAFGVVAGLAAGRKRPVMRVLVAAAAGLKVDSFVLDDFRVRLCRLMALRAFDASVLPGQREMRHRMIECFYGFPVVVIVAGLAFGAQLAFVMVLMTREAGRVQAFERPRQIVNHDDFSVCHGDVLRVMALFAFQLRVLAEEHITGLLMIEFIFGGIPLEDAEVLAVVLGVASGAIGIPLAAIGHAPVHTLMRFHETVDLAMAVEALQLFRAGAKTMTACAL